MTSATQQSACANPQKTAAHRAILFSYVTPVAEKCLLPSMQDFIHMTTQYPGGDVPEAQLKEVRENLLKGWAQLREEANYASNLSFKTPDAEKTGCCWESHAADYALTAMDAARSAFEACMPEMDDNAVREWARMSTKESIVPSPLLPKSLIKNPSALRLFSLWCLSQVAEKTTCEAVLACAKLMVTHPDGHIPPETLQMHAQSLQQAHRETDRSARQAWQGRYKAVMTGTGDVNHLKQLAISASVQDCIVKVGLSVCNPDAWEGATAAAYWMRNALDDEWGKHRDNLRQKQAEVLNRCLEAL